MALTYNPTAGATNQGEGTLEVDPISRIEGHLGVKLDVTDGMVTGADMHGNLWRGFENFLIGRDVNDAITFTQRICGVCPVPHGQTATFAVDAVLGLNDNFQTWIAGGPRLSSADGATVVEAAPGNPGVPAKALHIRNLVLSAEFLMSHITHSYHLAAPSYIQGPNIPPWTPYYDNVFYHSFLRATGNGVNAAGSLNFDKQAITGATLPADSEGFSKDLWSAVIKQYVKALRIRRLTFEAGALFAGRMPMTSCYIGGGVTNDKSEVLTAKCGLYRELMEEIGTFIVQEFVPLFLALGALYPNYDNKPNADLLTDDGGANRLWLWTAGNQAAVGAQSTANTGWGAGCMNYLAWGGFPLADGTLGLARGYKTHTGGVIPTVAESIGTDDVLTNLREHIAHSRYSGASSAVDNAGDPNPTGVTDPYTESRTMPDRSAAGVAAGKYSWLKAPRWNGKPMEVGPMARMFVAGFFEQGVALATSMATAGLPDGMKGYDTYTKTALSGLDPAMINADLAVACVRAGIATLEFELTGDLEVTVYAGDPLEVTPVTLGAGVYTVTNSGVNSTTGGNLNISTLTGDTIGTAYSVSNAIIKGALAAWVINLKAGASTMDRLRARPLESFVLVQRMIGGFTKGATGVDALSWNSPGTYSGGWVAQLAGASGDTYTQVLPRVGTYSGFGAAEAPRGALMHMVTVTNDKIVRYQCIVPTTWNASPKDASDAEGPIEAALLNIPYKNTRTAATAGDDNASISAGGGVEALRVTQSFDPCIACAVH